MNAVRFLIRRRLEIVCVCHIRTVHNKTHGIDALLGKCKGSYLLSNSRTFHNSSSLLLFWEPDTKGGYVSKEPKPSHGQLMRTGFKEMKKEIELWKEEMREKMRGDSFMLCRPGETDIIWNFNSPETLDSWVTTSDIDHGEGMSTCSLSITPNGRGLFSGVLNTRVPKDGRVKKAGYCNMKSLRARKSFKRETYYDWGTYNHLVLRVRGDGRSYLLNISIMGYFDILWNDVYHYVLYTRGGPYWQVAKIPFSKFFLGSKGRVQDRQSAVPLSQVSHFGISAADNINGPFNLEIDYIGLEHDPNHHEEFAYEMYTTDHCIAAH